MKSSRLGKCDVCDLPADECLCTAMRTDLRMVQYKLLKAKGLLERVRMWDLPDRLRSEINALLEEIEEG